MRMIITIFIICFVGFCYAKSNHCSNYEEFRTMIDSIKTDYQQDMFKIETKTDFNTKYWDLTKWTIMGFIAIITLLIGMIAIIQFYSISRIRKETKLAETEITKINELIVGVSEKAKTNILEEIMKTVSNVNNEENYDICRRLMGSTFTVNFFDNNIPTTNYQSALDRLLILYQKQYQLKSVTRHIGVCYYNLNQYDESIDFFNEFLIIYNTEDSVTEEIKKLIKEMKDKI